MIPPNAFLFSYFIYFQYLQYIKIIPMCHVMYDIFYGGKLRKRPIDEKWV